MKKEILNKIKKAKFCFVNCTIDGEDVAEYFRTPKSEIYFYVRKYIKNNLEYGLNNLNNTIVLREDGDLYVN